jgi:hypothetical protein
MPSGKINDSNLIEILDMDTWIAARDFHCGADAGLVLLRSGCYPLPSLDLPREIPGIPRS